MSSRFIQEIAANQSIDTTIAFDATFPSRTIDEVLAIFDPKHSALPICVLGNEAGGSKELHMHPSLGREGHFAAKLGGEDRWSKISVRLVRGKPAKLMQLKFIGKPPA